MENRDQYESLLDILNECLVQLDALKLPLVAVHVDLAIERLRTEALKNQTVLTEI